MEKTKNIKKKIITALCSMVVCFALIGTAVWAATSQSATLSNTITVSQSGQAKTTVSVKEYINTGSTAVTTVPDSAPTFGTALNEKDGQGTLNDNEKEYELTAIAFSTKQGKNYYGYEIVITNESSDTGITVTPNVPDFAGSTDVDVYAGTTWEGMTKLAGDYTTASTTIAAGGQYTLYVMVCANCALADLSSLCGATDWSMTFTATAV